MGKQQVNYYHDDIAHEIWVDIEGEPVTGVGDSKEEAIDNLKAILKDMGISSGLFDFENINEG